MRRAAILTALCLALAGCGNGDDTLSDCLATSEQTVLLTQLAAPAATRASFDQCIASGHFSQAYCRALWLDADNIVHACMKRGGYVLGGHSGDCKSYADAACYKPAWLMQLRHWFDALQKY